MYGIVYSLCVFQFWPLQNSKAATKGQNRPVPIANVRFGSLANKLSPAKIDGCPLWSKSGQTRAQLGCPLSANSGQIVAVPRMSAKCQ